MQGNPEGNLQPHRNTFTYCGVGYDTITPYNGSRGNYGKLEKQTDGVYVRPLRCGCAVPGAERVVDCFVDHRNDHGIADCNDPFMAVPYLYDVPHAVAEHCPPPGGERPLFENVESGEGIFQFAVAAD